MGPEAFRIQAEECMRLADDACDPQHRAMLYNMARTWGVLAESAEKLQIFLERRETVSQLH